MAKMKKHIANDEVISTKEVRKSENKMNLRAEHVSRITMAGEDNGQSKRIKGNLKVKDNQIPILHRTSKDHKVAENHKEGPDVRPIMGAVVQSRRREAAASTIPPVLQRFRKSVYLVQLSKSGKYASGKKVAQNTSEYCNIARHILQFNNLALGASTLLRINVFSATFLPDAYLPDFDSCTKYTDFRQR
jgi:hypothetical protein